MNIAEKIVLLRKKKGISQEELANELNTSRQAISKWENNRSTNTQSMKLKRKSIFHIV